jgi:hypothetical protein
MATNETPHASLGCTFIILLGVSLFTGIILCAVAGGAIFPPAIRIGAPLVCNEELALESREYTPEDGGVGIERTFYCQSAETGVKEDITIRLILTSGLIYSAIIFFVLLVMVVISRLRSSGRPTTAPTPATVAVPAATPANPGEAETAARLRHLQELRDSGLLTEQEYETKRAEILAKL